MIRPPYTPPRQLVNGLVDQPHATIEDIHSLSNNFATIGLADTYVKPNLSHVREFVPKITTPPLGNPITTECDIIFPVAQASTSLSSTSSSPSILTSPTFKNLSVAAVPEFVPRSTLRGNRSHSKEDGESKNDSCSFPDSDISTLPASIYNTYQENVNGTIYFYTAPEMQNGPAVDLSSGMNGVPRCSVSTGSSIDSTDGEDIHVTSEGVNYRYKPTPFFPCPDENMGLVPAAETELSSNFIELPEKVGDYVDLIPLEIFAAVPSTSLTGYFTSTFKATHQKTLESFYLRRIHSVLLPSVKCNNIANAWKKVYHSNLARFKEMLVTREFGDNSIVFVYDYYDGAETLLSKHFSQMQVQGTVAEMFSSDPNAPRPYSHLKNALLRQQYNTKANLSESAMWNYAIQLTGALKVIHGAGLSCRCIDPTKVILTSGNRVRISGVAIADIILYHNSLGNRSTFTSHFQQEDLSALGKLLLAISCGTLLAIKKENISLSLEILSKSYSADLRNLLAYLLSGNQRRSILELMPMIGARFYSHIEAMQLQCDASENQWAKQVRYKQLLQLWLKFNYVNEWCQDDAVWSANGDGFLLMLFKDYLFRQMAEDGRPWIDIPNVVLCLTKLHLASTDKVCLVTRTGESLVYHTSYAELKECLDRCCRDLSQSAAYAALDLEKMDETTQPRTV